jgi:hypothetical protein
VVCEDLAHRLAAGYEGFAALADAPAGQELFHLLEVGILATGDAAHGVLDHGLGLAAVKGFVQPAIHQQPALVAGVGDAIGPVEGQRVGALEAIAGGCDFRVAVGAFHEQHLAPGGKAPPDAFQGFCDGLNRPGDDPGDGLLEVCRDAAGDDADAFKAQALHGEVEKLDALAAAFSEQHLDVRPVDLERDPGHPRAGAHIQQRGGQRHHVRRQDRVDVELEHHVGEVVDPGEVELGVVFTQQTVVHPQLLQLSGIQAEAAGVQQRPQVVDARRARVRTELTVLGGHDT